jgi:hypothetical protein
MNQEGRKAGTEEKHDIAALTLFFLPSCFPD